VTQFSPKRLKMTEKSEEEFERDLAVSELEKVLDLLQDFLTVEASGTDCEGMIGEEGELGPKGDN
jgi:hypothetical protein